MSWLLLALQKRAVIGKKPPITHTPCLVVSRLAGIWGVEGTSPPVGGSAGYRKVYNRGSSALPSILPLEFER
ncbi:MAG: hypothetical protein ACK5QT_01995 [Oligoflexia bacterium]